MAPPVWVLSVDLQTKTATFQTGMAEAAKAARGAFGEIRSGAQEMGAETGYSMMEARHSVMILGEEFGVHLPRALTSFIASLGPLGPALEAAFPFLAVALGATLLIEHLAKLHEEGEKLTEDQVKFGTAMQSAFTSLQEKLLQAEIRSDELRNDHLGALKLQLELIDKQSMTELMHSFELVAKAADVVMKDLEGHWYTFGVGSDGAKHNLDEFQTKYESLLALKTDAGKQEAHNLLSGTLKTAEDVLKAQETIKQNRDSGSGQTDESFAAERTLKAHQASLSVTENELKAQRAVVDALQKQVEIEGTVAAIQAKDSGNAKTQTGNEEAARRAAGARQAAESMLRLGEQSIAADRATAEALLTIHRASLEQRLSNDLDFAARDRDVKLAANAAEISALDKSGKDYQNQLKGLQEKALEINQEYATKTAELSSKSSIDVANRELRSLEQSEREKIEAVRQGSAARIAEIDAALKIEEQKGLQDTNFYRELLNMRVEAVRQATEEEGKLREQSGIEAAESDLKIGELRLAMARAHQQMLDSARVQSEQHRLSEALAFAEQEYRIKADALAKEEGALDQSAKDYENKLKALQDKEKQLTQQHENEITAIKERAETERNQRVLSSFTRFNDDVARGLTQSIMGHETWSKMILSFGDQVVSGMIENALKSIMADDMTKERDAASAARSAFLAGMKFPFPANIIAAPVLAAGAFASVMAFEGGTDSVPGYGRGDKVAAMLEPQEGVVPGGVMDGLRKVAARGGFDSGGPRYNVTTHVHMHASALDSDGMDEVLTRHADTLQQHFERTLRRMNR